MNLITYSAPEAARRSPHYRLSAGGQELFVYETGVHLEPEHRNLVAAYAYFDCDGDVEICVQCDEPVRDVAVRPLSLGIKASVYNEREIRFRISGPCKLSVDINGRTDGNLIIFAGEPLEAPPCSASDDVLYFGPGIHSVTDDEYGILRVRSGQTIYLAGGAILRARIAGEGVESVTIRGRGILDGSTLLARQPQEWRKLFGESEHLKRPMFVDFRESRNIRIEGIHLIDSPHWTVRFLHCQHVACHDLRLIGAVGNSDGIDIVSTQHARITDTFIRTADDCIVIKGQPLAGRRQDVFDVRAERCTLWADRASALEIGHETICDQIRDVHFSDIDILYQKLQCVGYHAINVHGGDDAVIHDIHYRNIRVERSQRLIGMKIEAGIFNRAPRRGRIHDITFDGIHSLDKADLHLYGESSESTISDFRFRNITLAGRPVQLEVFANRFVHDLQFIDESRLIRSVAPENLRFTPVDLAGAAQHSLEAPLPVGRHLLNGVEFEFAAADQKVVLLRGGEYPAAPLAATIPINRRGAYLFFLCGCIGDRDSIGTVIWQYNVHYAGGGREVIPVRFNLDVAPWNVWAPGGWIVKLAGRKFYVHLWRNPRPEDAVDHVEMVSAGLRETPLLLALSLGHEA